MSEAPRRADGDAAAHPARAAAAAHPPPLPGMPTLDDVVPRARRLAAGRLRAAADRLPWRLGLTSVARRRLGRLRRPAPEPRAARLRGAGAGRAASARSAGRSPSLSCARTTSAASPGCCAIASRTGRSATDDELLELADVFERRWREALVARRPATPRWRTRSAAGPPRAGGAGRAPRRRVLARGSLRSPIYAAVVREKLGWIGAPAQALLADSRRSAARDGVPARARSVPARAASDRRRDRCRSRIARCAAATFRRRSGCSPGALVRAAPKLVQRAAVAAARAAASPGSPSGSKPSRTRSRRGASTETRSATSSTRSASPARSKRR